MDGVGVPRRSRAPRTMIGKRPSLLSNAGSTPRSARTSTGRDDAPTATDEIGAALRS
jgi:hypothetical protein